MPLHLEMTTYTGPDSHEAKAREAVAWLERLVNSAQFRTKVESVRRFKYNEGLSSRRVYNRLMTGDHGGAGDLDAERTVAFHYNVVPGEDGSVVGYRTRGTSNIATYENRFVELELDDLVSHLAHEVIGHLAGEFSHPRLRWRGRGRSVPYTVDRIVEELAEDGVGAPS